MVFCLPCINCKLFNTSTEYGANALSHLNPNPNLNPNPVRKCISAQNTNIKISHVVIELLPEQCLNNIVTMCPNLYIVIVWGTYYIVGQTLLFSIVSTILLCNDEISTVSNKLFMVVGNRENVLIEQACSLLLTCLFQLVNKLLQQWWLNNVVTTLLSWLNNILTTLFMLVQTGNFVKCIRENFLFQKYACLKCGIACANNNNNNKTFSCAVHIIHFAHMDFKVCAEDLLCPLQRFQTGCWPAQPCSCWPAQHHFKPVNRL